MPRLLGIEKMPTQALFALTAAVVAGVVIQNVGWAAPLAPNDPSVAGDLLVWLRDPADNYNAGTGTWTDISGNGFDATAVGTATNGLNYAAPVADTIDPVGGVFDSLSSVLVVKFQGSDGTGDGADDLLRSPAINGGESLLRGHDLRLQNLLGRLR